MAALAPQAEAVLATKKRSLADEIAVNDEAEHAFSAVTGEQLRNLGVQRDALRAQLELLGARDKLQQAQVQRSAELLKGGYVTAEYDAKTRSDEFTLQIQQNEVRQKIADVEQQMLNARQDRTDKVNQMRAGRLRAAQDIAEIDSRLQSAAGNRSVDVRAAEPGRLAALHVNDGDFVTEDTPLATLEQASGGTEIVCFADAQAVGDLRVGAPVKVSFPAFPYLIHGVADATVVEIDSAPWLGDAAQGAGAPLKAAANPRYRVVARIDSPERLARARIRAVAGMAAVVQIPHATRTLFQWLFLTAGPNDR
ncbi:MAG TPA: HlyD family efflux transporter periplasmic adaptor subunit [Burkholderiaceae bacterium]